MAVKFLRRGKIPTVKDKQKEVNKYFMEMVTSLFDAIIDEANDKCYERYKLYPNVYTIKLMRNKINGVRQNDLEMLKKVFDIA